MKSVLVLIFFFIVEDEYFFVTHLTDYILFSCEWFPLYNKLHVKYYYTFVGFDSTRVLVRLWLQKEILIS